jgi:hypothetical protein
LRRWAANPLMVGAGRREILGPRQRQIQLAALASGEALA